MKNPQPETEEPNSGISAKARPVIEVDYDRYTHLLDDKDISDQEKQAFFEALCYALKTFVELGFGIEPVQQAMKANRKNPHPTIPLVESTDAPTMRRAFTGANAKKSKGENTERNTR